MVRLANEGNLRPLNTRTKSEQREIQKKGGKKSGEARRKKRALKDCAEQLLSMPVAGKSKIKLLSELGMKDADMYNHMLLVVSLFNKAVYERDVAAFKEIRNLIGEDAVNNGDGKLEDLIRGLQDEDV